jgi:hypothetical protein
MIEMDVSEVQLGPRIEFNPESKLSFEAMIIIKEHILEGKNCFCLIREWGFTMKKFGVISSSIREAAGVKPQSGTKGDRAILDYYAQRGDLKYSF